MQGRHLCIRMRPAGVRTEDLAEHGLGALVIGLLKTQHRPRPRLTGCQQLGTGAGMEDRGGGRGQVWPLERCVVRIHLR